MERVPFFVRRRAKRKVEEEARRRGAPAVTMEHVEACRRQMIDSMESEVKGYQVEICFGASGCPNRLVYDSGLAESIEGALDAQNLKAFLRERVQGQLKLHHEFRVSIACCPNACSRPQIADFGLIGACTPELTGEACSQCGACLEACRDEAISVPPGGVSPIIDGRACVACGQCGQVCPTGTIITPNLGYRILLGGKLGRHPQLGRELAGTHTALEVEEVFARCLRHYLAHNRNGERFGEILSRVPLEDH
jgi:dissimilatory sulfite reductase (desulfoviridin) alpha/beta subunit